MSIASRIEELEKFLDSMPEPDRKALEKQLWVENKPRAWEPLPGPQTDAYYCEADILFYGGQAGGGKSDLICGLAVNEHTESIIFRRESKQLVGIVQRLTDILGTRKHYNAKDEIWNLPDRRIELGSCKDVGDEIKYQGRPHSLKAFDEITHFMESQFRFLMGWKRTTKQNERQRVVCTGNPPTDSDGQWVIDFWGPWLDKKHPNPAQPGELRWYVTFDNGIEQEAEGPDPVKDPGTGEWVKPLSRTFIPSSVEDNPYLMKTDYKATLQAMPEPLRSQMLKGDFGAGLEDDAYQVLPTAWVEAAMNRWQAAKDKGFSPQGEMDSMGVDVARGGRDKTVISRRYGGWFEELISMPGEATPNGQAVAGLVVQYRRDASPVHVDVIGIGSSAYDFMVENNMQAIPIVASNKSHKMVGPYKMRNKRAEMYWELREALDPKSRSLLALPNDRELLADLCAPRYKIGQNGIQVESKEELIKRIGRSTDKGDAVCMAYMHTEKEYAEEDDDLSTPRGSRVTGY